MSTKEADHGRATYPDAHRLPARRADPVSDARRAGLEGAGAARRRAAELRQHRPDRFLSPAAFGRGFLGPQYAPLIVGENAQLRPAAARAAPRPDALKVQDLDLPGGVDADAATPASSCWTSWRRTSSRRARRRLAEPPHRLRPGGPADAARRRVKAFDLDEEPEALRDAYGRNLFGQGCLLARRLVERGVPFVEVRRSEPAGTRTSNNFDAVQAAAAACSTRPGRR